MRALNKWLSSEKEKMIKIYARLEGMKFSS
jgi:hypothetical protein